MFIPPLAVGDAGHEPPYRHLTLCVAGARVILSCMNVRNCDVCKVAAMTHT